MNSDMVMNSAMVIILLILFGGVAIGLVACFHEYKRERQEREMIKAQKEAQKEAELEYANKMRTLTAFANWFKPHSLHYAFLVDTLKTAKVWNIESIKLYTLAIKESINRFDSSKHDANLNSNLRYVFGAVLSAVNSANEEYRNELIQNGYQEVINSIPTGFVGVSWEI